MKFNYIAKKISGEERKGVMEAKDKFELSRTLREDGYTLVSCKEVKERKKMAFLSKISFGGGASTADKMIFARNLSVMMGAGVSAPRAMEVLSRQTESKTFKKAILDVGENIQKGTSLSEALARYPKIFSPLFVAMVKVGEESGKLSDSLKIVSDQLDRDHTLLKKVKGALIYPSIILVLMISIGILMLIYVVPTLVSNFAEMNLQLPVSTQVIIFMSNFIVGNLVLFLVTLAAIIFSGIYFVRSRIGQRILDNVFIRLPIVSGLVKKFNSARTSRTLASLISSGVNIVETLSITSEVVQNHNYKIVLDKAKADIQKGTLMSASFKSATRLYPPLVGEMMAVGEETGKLGEMLNRLADFYEEEVSVATKDLSTIIEPVLMVIIGVFVGFFAISMIKPMYSMTEAIR